MSEREGRQSNLGFRLMSLMFRVRDLLRPRSEVLAEVGIQPGDSVLDFGCGPGGYISGLVASVGPSGRVWALDTHPLAVRQVRETAARRGFSNVEAIESDGDTGLPDESLDVVLLYDVFHHLADPDGILRELHRVLKHGGTLSFSDHHLRGDEAVSRVIGTGLFTLVRRGAKTFTFAKA